MNGPQRIIFHISYSSITWKGTFSLSTDRRPSFSHTCTILPHTMEQCLEFLFSSLVSLCIYTQIRDFSYMNLFIYIDKIFYNIILHMVSYIQLAWLIVLLPGVFNSHSCLFVFTVAPLSSSRYSSLLILHIEEGELTISLRRTDTL